MSKPRLKGTLYDGQYRLDIEFSDISPDSGKYVSPYESESGRVIVNPDQPEFDRVVAMTHEIWHHIAWTREAKSTFVSHTALEYHACRFVAMLQNSPKLAEYYYLFAKKGAKFSP